MSGRPVDAAAWVRLAERHRLTANDSPSRAVREHERAEAVLAFEQALALDPDLAVAHSLYAQLEIDLGMAQEAAVRLLVLLDRHGPDADAYAGLVRALRFCGLLHESHAAHERARALDAAIITSVAHTNWLLGDYQAAAPDATGGIADPEALYYIARTHAKLGDHTAALKAILEVLDAGYICYPALLTDPWLDDLRESGELDRAIDAARAQHERARDVVMSAGGDRLS